LIGKRHSPGKIADPIDVVPCNIEIIESILVRNKTENCQIFVDGFKGSSSSTNRVLEWVLRDTRTRSWKRSNSSRNVKGEGSSGVTRLTEEGIGGSINEGEAVGSATRTGWLAKKGTTLPKLISEAVRANEAPTMSVPVPPTVAPKETTNLVASTVATVGED